MTFFLVGKIYVSTYDNICLSNVDILIISYKNFKFFTIIAGYIIDRYIFYHSLFFYDNLLGIKSEGYSAYHVCYLFTICAQTA